MALLELFTALPLSMYGLLAVLALAVFAGNRWLAAKKRQGGFPLPPSPPGEPILGHLRVIPTDNPEYAYAQWAKELGSDVISFRILGQPVVVLNSARSAIDLLDKRGANYADRPRFVLFEAMGWRKTLTFLRAGPEFRKHRRILQKGFQKTSIVVYRGLQRRETVVMLEGLAAQPAEWERVMRRFATAIVMGIGFGIQIHDDASPYIQMATDASYALGHGGAPAGTPVDYFPLLKHLPNWLVRDRSLKFARDWRWAIRQIHDAPYAAVTAAAEEGKAEHQDASLISLLLDQRRQQMEKGKGGGGDIDEEDIKGAAGAVYAAGQDTTWATLIVFTLNMVLQPGVQAKAQTLLDEVLGDRLPTFDDQPRLKYIEYIVQETLRWCPVSPVGVPHRAIHDDVYDGMFIPAGAYVYANARSITHDERTYSDPEAFNPDRYAPVEEGGLGEPYPLGQFGFGRRICVGQHLAQASVWIAVACMLKTFDIKKQLDADGRDITPVVELTNGLTSHPKEFPCRIVPRSAKALEVLKNDGQSRSSNDIRQ